MLSVKHLREGKPQSVQGKTTTLVARGLQMSLKLIG